MAKIRGTGTVTSEITIVLSEIEAAALDALVGYGFKPFIEAFYKEMGRHYLEPYEAGLKSLFESVRTGEGSVSGFLARTREARSVFTGTKIATQRPVEVAATPESK